MYGNMYPGMYPGIVQMNPMAMQGMTPMMGVYSGMNPMMYGMQGTGMMPWQAPIVREVARETLSGSTPGMVCFVFPSTQYPEREQWYFL
jgi:hypothetical protein